MRLDAARLPQYHHSTAFLSEPAPPELNLALLVLNVDEGENTACSRFAHLWSSSSVRLCADGAANRLHDSLCESERSKMLPDMIGGDMDSLRSDVAEYYRSRGVAIEGESGQDTHDFEKCLRWLERRQRLQPSGSAPYSVVAHGAFGGRLDQQMANLNMVYSIDTFPQLYLLSRHSLAFLLRPGTHVIETNPQAEDGTCGLIPLGGRCDGVQTRGYAALPCTSTGALCPSRPPSRPQPALGSRRLARARIRLTCLVVEPIRRAHHHDRHLEPAPLDHRALRLAGRRGDTPGGGLPRPFGCRVGGQCHAVAQLVLRRCIVGHIISQRI